MTDFGSRTGTIDLPTSAAAAALNALLLEPDAFGRTTESIPELLLRRLLTLAPSLGQRVFQLDADERLVFEKGRRAQQADIVGYGLRHGAAPGPNGPEDHDWVARVQIEVKLNANYNSRKEKGQYVYGETQLDRYAAYADANRGCEAETSCWVLMPATRAGDAPEFHDAYAGMRSQGVQAPERWRIATWEQVRLWLQTGFREQDLAPDVHTDLIRYLAQGLDED